MKYYHCVELTRSGFIDVDGRFIAGGTEMDLGTSSSKE